MGEDALNETQRLESLGLLAVSIAHDVNNLLTAIGGHAGLISLALSQGQDPEPHLRHLQQAVGLARDLARQLQDYAGKGNGCRCLFDLSDLVRDMAGLLRVSLPKSVTVLVEEEGALPMLGNPGTLKQVVLNLVTNAADALGPEGGTIRLSTRRIEGPRSFARLEVSDSGCGMDESTLARIFEPFFSTKGQGRGLGLAALQGILQAHGGTIRVESAVGEGTTFQVELPLAEW